MHQTKRYEDHFSTGGLGNGELVATKGFFTVKSHKNYSSEQESGIFQVSASVQRRHLFLTKHKFSVGHRGQDRHWVISKETLLEISKRLEVAELIYS